MNLAKRWSAWIHQQPLTPKSYKIKRKFLAQNAILIVILEFGDERQMMIVKYILELTNIKAFITKLNWIAGSEFEIAQSGDISHEREIQ